jgi:hypothetical protein
VSERTPEIVLAVLVVVLAAGALLLGGGSEAPDREAAIVAKAHIELIERRVEELRRLRFKHPVPVAVVSPAQARREALAEFDRTQSPAQQRTNEEVWKLLGLVPADMDHRDLISTLFSEQIAGYYEPQKNRLALVRGAGVDDITLAHELTHALEDQHVDLAELGVGGAGDDAATAEQALIEGTATAVMEQYAARWPSEAPLGDALSGLTALTGGTPLPPYVLRSLIFPYIQGERFVQALLDADDGEWGLVDVALRARPPQTTAEILDPQRWVRAVQPAPLSLRRIDAAGGWRRLTGGTLGEEDLAALLSPTAGPARARRLTGGWQGGRYALWRRGPLVDPGCPAPCRRRDVLAIAVRVERARQAEALGASLGAWLGERLNGRRVGPGAADRAVWQVPRDAYGAVRWWGAEVRVALAPSAALARALVR